MEETYEQKMFLIPIKIRSVYIPRGQRVTKNAHNHRDPGIRFDMSQSVILFKLRMNKRCSSEAG